MSSAIRLVFDAHAIAPQRSGIGDYSYHLVEALLQYHPADIKLHLYASGRIKRVKSMDEVLAATARIAPGSLYSPKHQFELPGLLTRRKYDLLHVPDYCIPVFNFKIPMVATIHDIVPLAMPHLLNKSKKVKLLRLYKWYVTWAALACREIITVSEFSKQEILRCIPAAEQTLHAIHVSSYVEPVSEFQPFDVIPGLEPGRYFLFIGRHEPYKGIRQLLEAYASVRDEIADDVSRLVFAGKIDARYPWREITRELGIENKILFTGYISERQLSWAYTHAKALVFPSLYEGFGSPPLDAMTHRCPIVCSNRASIPEVVGDAGMFFDPEDNDAFASALRDIACDTQLRTDLIEKGARRIQDFSWELTAAKTVEVYRTALRGKAKNRRVYESS